MELCKMWNAVQLTCVKCGVMRGAMHNVANTCDLKCGMEYMECSAMGNVKWDARCGAMHNVADISGAI